MDAEQPDRKAAAVIKQRGVTVHVYGPIADRKKEVYLLAYYVGSRREKQTVKGTLEEAKRKAKEVANGISAGDIIDALHLSPLDRRVYITAKEACAALNRPVDAVCREAVEAVNLLGSGVSLMDAARFWIAHHSTGLKRATVTDVAKALFAQLETKRRADVTVTGLKTILDLFGKAFQVPIADIQTHEIEQWLGTLKLGPRTLNNYRAGILRLFNFARGEYLPKDRPTAAQSVERVTEERGAVEIFRPWELAALLAHADDDLLPCIAIGAFAGARNVELTRMEWSALHLETSETYPHGYLELKKSVAKQHRTASRRIVPVQENLAKWLTPYANRVGPISPYKHQSSLSRAITLLIDEVNKKEAKIRKREVSRPKNGLRHSYGSYRLPIVKSAAALAIEMNNSEQEIWRDYHELAPPKDVEAYWQIAPSKGVVQFQIA